MITFYIIVSFLVGFILGGVAVANIVDSDNNDAFDSGFARGIEAEARRRDNEISTKN